MTRITFALLALFVASASAAEPPPQPAAWYKLGDVTFPERRTITITNSTAAAVNGFPVQVGLNDLPVADEARGTAIIVDPQAKPARKGESGGALVPHQVNNNVLTFSASLGPNQTRTWYLYTTRQPIIGVTF